jgi:hypothetical protein
MRFAKWVFLLAGASGVLMRVNLSFMFGVSQEDGWSSPYPF